MSLLAYIALVYAFIADVTIFNLSFVAMELSGAAIITFFNLFTIWYKMKYGPPEEEEKEIDETISEGSSQKNDRLQSDA